MAKQVRPKSAQGSASSLIFTFDVKLARCFVLCFFAFIHEYCSDVKKNSHRSFRLSHLA